MSENNNPVRPHDYREWWDLCAKNGFNPRILKLHEVEKVGRKLEMLEQQSSSGKTIYIGKYIIAAMVIAIIYLLMTIPWSQIKF